MKPRRSISRRLEQALQDLEDGSLSADDHWWLMSQLRESPEVRRAYREHMAFATALHGTAEAWAPAHGAEESVYQIPPASRWQRLPRKTLLAAAALVALLAVAVSIFALRSPSPAPARVSAGAETQWEYTSGGIGKDGEFLPGTRLLVDRGSVEIATRSGNRMFVEGPATLEISDPSRVSLSSGKGWFEAAPGEENFTVVTDRLRANGMGTRFGVAVSTGGDRIQVEAGTLRVESKLPGIPVTNLGPGQAVTSDLAGRSKPSPVDPGLFLDDLPKETAFIHWSFDEEVSGAFPASAQGMSAAPIRVTGVGGKAVTPRPTGGIFGSALDLTDGTAFGESDFPGISGSGPRTVALWIKGRPIVRRENAKRVDYTPSVVMWGDQSINGGSWTFRAHCITGIIGTQWGSNGLLTAGKIGSMSVLDDQWHHIASVFTGEISETGEVEVRHYIDGQRVFTTAASMEIGVDTRLGSQPANRLRVACDNQMPGGPGNVPVAVDELFIFRSALSDEQIKILCRENRFSLRE